MIVSVAVTLAYGERSFSKWKLIKNYFRSTMSQKRLNGLTMLSIEKDWVKNLDYQKMGADRSSNVSF